MKRTNRMEKIRMKPETIAALEAWVADATQAIMADPDRFVTWFRIPSWVAMVDGTLRLVPVSCSYSWSELDNNVFSDSKSWLELCDQAERDQLLSLHIGKLVGSINTGKQWMSLPTFCQTLLPEIKWLADDRILLDQSNQKTKFDNLVDFLNNDVITFTKIWIFEDLRSDDIIEIADGITFRRLTETEKSLFANLCIRFDPSTQNIPATNQDWFGLCVEAKVPKEVGETDSARRESSYIHPNEWARILQAFIALVGLTCPETRGEIYRNVAAPSCQFERDLAFGISGHPTAGGHYLNLAISTGCTLTADHAHLITDGWRTLYSELLRSVVKKERSGGKSGKETLKNKLLYALRRQLFSESRSNPQDALVDLMIAVEALFGDGQGGEITYKISTRAALFHSENPEKRLEVFTNFSKAYDIRSQIVHGKLIQDQDATLHIQRIKPVLLDAFEKAFALIRSNPSEYTIDWKKIVFNA